MAAIAKFQSGADYYEEVWEIFYKKEIAGPSHGGNGESCRKGKGPESMCKTER